MICFRYIWANISKQKQKVIFSAVSQCLFQKYVYVILPVCSKIVQMVCAPEDPVVYKAGLTGHNDCLSGYLIKNIPFM